ncbi:MAG TPA: tetratricopeptide repeat protein [Longimicrobium sp.]|nr:tetratricopeptide repeat protein [Longimicrobium sp.]
MLAPLAVPDGAVAGADIVRELAPELSLTVWQALRSVLLWAAQEPSARGELWERATMVAWEEELLEAPLDNDLRYPLAVIAGELALGAGADPDRLSRGCVCVTEWALSNGAVCTALAFAEAAAHAWPEHGRYAWLVGRLLRAHGRLRDAELWIRRAVQVAVSTGDWETQTLGLNSLGNVFYERGNYREATSSHVQALRIARRQQLREREGEILHDLFVSTWHTGDLEQAEGYARSALEIYQGGHERLPALAYDIAFSWMSNGYFERALPLLIELSDRFDRQGDQVRVLASSARAAAACGREALFNEYAKRTETAAAAVTGHGVAYAMFALGLGAWNLKRWNDASEYLIRALMIAEQRGEADVTSNAEAALSSVRMRQLAEVSQRESSPHVSLKRAALASHFASSLRAVAAAP